MKKRPKIVFLDAASVDFGDLDTSLIQKQGLYRAYPNLSFRQVGSKAGDAEIVLANKFLINEEFLDQLPQLKLVCIAATGINNVDLPALKKRGIALTNVADYSTQTVAEHTLLFLLALSHRLPEHMQASIDKRWSRSPFFAFLDTPFCDLAGKTLGLVGYGHIGKKVARLAKAFGMKVLVAHIPGRKKTRSHIPLKSVLKQSDYLSLHCRLSPLTQNLINAQSIALMKPTACVINVARGPIVNEKDIARALQKNKLRAYAADVSAIEPIPIHSPLLDPALRNKIILTPHIAWASKESRQRLMDEMALNIEAYLKNKKRNRIT